MNTKKKYVFMNGEVMLPLVVNQRAIIHSKNGWLHTSAVVSVKEISRRFVVFETQNSIYCVSPEPVSEMEAPTAYAARACA